MVDIVDSWKKRVITGIECDTNLPCSECECVGTVLYIAYLTALFVGKIKIREII